MHAAEHRKCGAVARKMDVDAASLVRRESTRY
jgi:hypothetical protein